MSTSDQTIESEIQAKGLTAPRITPDDVEAAIIFEHYFTAADALSRRLIMNQYVIDALPHITICTMILNNGHKIVGVNTGSVSTANLDAELARKLARKNATDQIWPLLGFALRERLAQAGAA